MKSAIQKISIHADNSRATMFTATIYPVNDSSAFYFVSHVTDMKGRPASPEPYKLSIDRYNFMLELPKNIFREAKIYHCVIVEPY